MSITKDGKTYRTYQEQVDYLTKKKNEIIDEINNLKEELEGVIINPMENEGDLIVGGENGEPTKLPIGSANKVLKVKNNSVSWEDDDSGMENPMTTAGDIIYAGPNGVPTSLPIGTAGQVLKVKSNGTGPEWSNGGGSGSVSLYLHHISMEVDDGNEQTAVTLNFYSENDTPIEDISDFIAQLAGNGKKLLVNSIIQIEYNQAGDYLFYHLGAVVVGVDYIKLVVKDDSGISSNVFFYEDDESFFVDDVITII